jgi:hypothetical protein
VKIFWKVASSPEISNPDLVKKAIEKMISLLKTNNDERLEKDLVIEAVQNVKRSVAVIQSLKIIRKVITLHEKPNAELIELVINENVVSHAFASFKKMKADFKNTGMKAGTALTDAAANQLLNDKNYNFEAHVQKRLAFIDFVLQNAQPSNQTTIAMINTIWDELVEDLVVESEAHYFKVWFTQVCGNSVKKIVSLV